MTPKQEKRAKAWQTRKPVQFFALRPEFGFKFTPPTQSERDFIKETREARKLYRAFFPADLGRG